MSTVHKYLKRAEAAVIFKGMTLGDANVHAYISRNDKSFEGDCSDGSLVVERVIIRDRPKTK